MTTFYGRKLNNGSEETKLSLIDEIRNIGKAYCSTNGSEHYVKIRQKGGVDAIEIAIQNNIFEDFAIVNITKYALRFKETRDLKELKKVCDYAQLLCGVEIKNNSDRDKTQKVENLKNTNGKISKGE